MIEELVELMSPRAQAKDLEIAAFVDSALPTHVVGDAARLRQVLLNLIGNAVKFTDQGGVSVIAEPGTWPDEVTLMVCDTGIGIAPELQARVFEEFEQADSGRTPPPRRHRAGALDLQAHRRAHGRNHHARKYARARVLIQLHGDVCRAPKTTFR